MTRELLKILVVLFVFSFAFAEPMTEGVGQGRETFLVYCAPCHGKDASGGSTPDIRGLPREDIAMAVQGVDQMPPLDIADEDLDAIATYLFSLESGE